MLNKKSIDEIEKHKFSTSFLKPLYESYCFSNIPGTIKSLLGLDTSRSLPKDVLRDLKNNQYEKVVLLFLDAFGWRFLQKYKDTIDPLKKIVDSSHISKLTSQFPSTTTAHVTTIHTGLDVGEHGLYEWNVYEPKLDTIITPLLFCYSGEKTRETLQTELNPNEIIPKNSIYSDLKENGVKSFVFQNKLYNDSSMSKRYFRDTEELIGFESVRECFTKLSDKYNKVTGKSYFFIYLDTIDYVSHRSGPESKEVFDETKKVFSLLKKEFLDKTNSGNGIFLLSADHGHADVSPKNEIFINKLIPEIEQYLETDKNGKPLGPAGSSRDLFLHIKNKNLNKAKTLIETNLKGVADVYLVSELINEGFFGYVSKSLEERIGDIVITPYKGYTVWFYDEKIERPKFLGHHGGLTKEEMEIPFITLEI